MIVGVGVVVGVRVAVGVQVGGMVSRGGNVRNIPPIGVAVGCPEIRVAEGIAGMARHWCGRGLLDGAAILPPQQ
ncbi:MAG: hypothetical protein KatS3mg051_0255 [Anaerolineae bacterium]|nr:MAG: hypothetical protein KatS3mg051_0255 [Anaerolineae bacterium]